MGNRFGNGTNISPAGSDWGSGFGFGFSSVNPSPRSFSAILWMADLGRSVRVWVWVWVWELELELELRIRNLRGLGNCEVWVLRSGDEEKEKKRGCDWSVRGFGGRGEVGS